MKRKYFSMRIPAKLKEEMEVYSSFSGLSLTDIFILGASKYLVDKANEQVDRINYIKNLNTIRKEMNKRRDVKNLKKKGYKVI